MSEVIDLSGFGTYLRTVRTYRPTGTSSDPASLQTLCNQMAGVGEVRLTSGTYDMYAASGSSALDLSACSNLVIVGHPSTRLIARLTAGGGGFLNFMIKSMVTEAGSVTLSSGVTYGSKTISVSASIAAGSEIRMTSAVGARLYLAARYTVKSVSGSGPYTLTLDRPVKFPFASGDAVKVISVAPQNVIIAGNGMYWGGPCDRLFEALAVRRYSVRDVRIGPNDAAAVATNQVSYDIGSVDVEFLNIHTDAAAGGAGILIESCDRASVIRCSADNGQNGIVLYDSVDSAVEDSNAASNSNANLTLDSNGMSIGCKDCMVRGGSFSKSTSNNGVTLQKDTDTTLIGVRADDNGSVGFAIASTTTRATLIKCKTRGNTTYDLQNSGVATKLVDYANQGGAVALQQSAGTITIEGCTLTGAVTKGIVCDAGTMFVRGLDIGTSSGTHGIHLQTAGTVWLSDSVIAPTGGSFAILASAGTLRICRTTLTTASYGLYSNGGDVQVGHDVVITCATPQRSDSGTRGFEREFRFSQLGVQPDTTTEYFGLDGQKSTTEAAAEHYVEKAITICDIDFHATAAPGATHSTVYMLRKNGADTAITITVGAADTSKVGPSGASSPAVAFAIGDRMCLRRVPDGAGNVEANPRIHVSGY